MDDSRDKKNSEGRSISEQSAALFVTNDDSLASMLLNHQINIRDFVVMSFLGDQGPMRVIQLARVVGIEPDRVLASLRRLAKAGLLLRDLKAINKNTFGETATLTSQGRDIVDRINAQL